MPNLQRLLRYIPGKVSDAYFNATDELFRRYHAGDTTMIREIANNAQSNGPVQTIMREAQKRKTGVEVDTDVQGALEIEMQRQERNLRMRLMEAEIEEKRAENQKRVLDNIQIMESGVARLSSGGKLEDRDRLMLKDMFRNAFTVPGVAAPPLPQITNGAETGAAQTTTEDRRPLTITTYASELGIKLSVAQQQAAGKIMAKLYRDTYHADPESHEQFVQGAVRPVKSYYHCHAHLMKRAIEEANKKN